VVNQDLSQPDMMIGDQIKIQSIGPVTCTTASGGECGTGELKSKVRLLVQEVGES
jgi:hypothetical protein